MRTLPLPLYEVAAIRALEHRACITAGIPSFTLMERAGAAAYRVLRERWPAARRIVVVCGSGNNAGDGYVLAERAREAGLTVSILQVGAPATRGDAAIVWPRVAASAIPLTDNLHELTQAEVIVDALFGIGLNRAPEGAARATIEAINRCAVPVLALDVPSGLMGDTGYAPGAVVVANVTVTFIAYKLGLVTGGARDFVGDLIVDALEIDPALINATPPSAELVWWDGERDVLPARQRSAHKGNHGHVLLVGGAPGMSGAIRLAAEACLRAGAGLVSVACASEHAGLINLGRPEIMAHAVTTPDDLAPLLARATVVAIGPGLSQTASATALWSAVRDWRGPMVVDADALNLLAHDPQTRENWVLTPHPGEAARLLGGVRTHEIAQNRYTAADRLRLKCGGAVVLKGAGTVIAAADRTAVLAQGNPGMAVGGMGDVLTGIIAALLAQGVPLARAASAGAALHAAAGDAAASMGERGLLASDLLPELRRLVNA